MRIGVVGASGFVGNRAIQLLDQHDRYDVLPIIHSPASIPRLTVPHLNFQIANSFDSKSLELAFQGCDVIIHSILGSPGLIRGSITPTYIAAQKAGVRRIIYLSSMIVHSSAPAPGTTEDSALIERQSFPTHTAKIYAERKLLDLRKNGDVEVVIFRPGIVFGPGSRWVSELVNQLSCGTAYFINEGKGVCNTVYVDNLIHAICLAINSSSADGEAFFVGDQEEVTWFDFYRPFAEFLNVDLGTIPMISAPKFKSSWKKKTVDLIWNSGTVQKFLSYVPDDFKTEIKNKVSRLNIKSYDSSNTALITPQPVVDEMMSILQQSKYKLPYIKAQKLLGYEPVVSFAEGCNRSIHWLQNTKDMPVGIKTVVA